MTKLQFNRKDLLNALSVAAGAVKSNSDKVIETHLLFSIKDKELTITGTGAELELSAKIQVDSPDLTFTAPAKKFIDVLRASDAEEVKLTLEDDTIKVQLGRGRFTLSSLEADKYPSMNLNMKGQTFSIKPALLGKLIHSAKFSMAKNDARYFLNGMKFEFQDNIVRVVATDGHRLAMNEADYTDEDCPAVNGEMNFILPAVNVEKLASLLKGENLTVRLTLLNNALQVDLGDVIFVSKLIDGRYPDYRRAIPKVSTLHYQVNANELKSVINRAKVMNAEKFFGIVMNFKDNEVEISTRNKTAENSSESLDCEKLDGSNDLEIGLNGEYLIQVLSVLGSEKLNMHCTDYTSPVLIKEESAMYVIMPMRF